MTFVVSGRVVRKKGDMITGYVRKIKKAPYLVIHTKAKDPVAITRQEIDNLSVERIVATALDPFIEYAVPDADGFYLLPYYNEF